MELILNKKKYALNLGQDFGFIGNYYKGKLKNESKLEITRLRPLFLGLNDCEEYILSLELGGFTRAELNFMEINRMKIIKPGEHIKLKNYNYYFLNKDLNLVNKLFQAWKDAKPGVHLGNYEHQHMDKIKNYTWAYKFNGVEY